MNNKTASKLDKFKPFSKDFVFRNYPFYWVIRLANRYTQVMEVPLKGMNLNITYWRVGLILRSYGKLSMTEISKHAVGRLPTVTKAVYRMQELGFVEITQNEEDKRVTMVEITPEGDDLLEAAIGRTTRAVDRAFEGLTEKEVTTLNVLLKKLFDNLSG
jgi:DNA-binding MarR family transcriptional regulator